MATAATAPRDQYASGSWPLVDIIPTPLGPILEVGAANPATGPWTTPRCAAVKNPALATEGSPGHLRRELALFNQAACGTAPNLVLAGRPPRGFLVFTFQPILVTKGLGHPAVVASGVAEVGALDIFTAFDWWRFVR